MSGVPYTFGNATTSIPLSQLDVNFATNATLGNASVGLGNTTTTVGNLTVSNISIVSTNGDAIIHGLTVGLGNSSAATNTAVGVNALLNNQAGGNPNDAFGNNALKTNTTGSYLSAFGSGSLFANTSGNANVGIGYNALTSNTTGSDNVAIGPQALQANTTASNNTAIGYQAGFGVTGSSNIMLGYNAGNGATTLSSGTNNLYIGNSTSASSASVNYELIIGSASGSTGKGASTGYINPNSGGVYQGNNSTLWSVTSDERLKKNIVDNTVGLTAINGIKIRNFEYRLPDEITDLDKSNAVNLVGTQLGVIAQELQQVLPDCVKTESTGVMSVDSSDVLWHLVTAVQQLSAQVTALQAKVGA